MATDIAFAIGALVLLANRIPKALVAFLVALAIVDDLGAVIVIAIFYTDQIIWEALSAAIFIFGLLVLLNRGGVRQPIPYLFLGSLLWFALLKSGVHATLAGVLTAFTIPARSKCDPVLFSEQAKELMMRFDASHEPGKSIMANDPLQTVVQTLKDGINKVETPLQRLEHGLHMPVAFLVIPIFAFFNAGIPINFSDIGDTLAHPVTLGVILGLTLGKLLGITGACWLALKLGIGQLPAHTRFSQIIGVSLLAGIGFTMSIFVSELGFSGQPEYLLMAKTGVLIASVLAGVSGFYWLRWVSCDTSQSTKKPA